MFFVPAYGLPAAAFCAACPAPFVFDCRRRPNLHSSSIVGRRVRPSAVITTGSEDFLSRVKEITGGKGVDVIFDPIAGDTLPALAEAVAWAGQIILYGTLEAAQTPYPLWAAFLRNFVLRTYMVYNFVGLSLLGLRRNEEAFSRAIKFVTGALASDRLRPIVSKTFPLKDIREAHRYLESNQQLGKVVVTV
jgi:NADPH:quinone reductase